MNYQILTDSCCDLPQALREEERLTVVPLSVSFRGQVFDDKHDDSLKELYAGLRAGETAQTSAVNPDRWTQAMEPVLAAGEDLLVLAFSSGLSTTYQSAVIAAKELEEQYPQRKIYVVDTLSASMGQGLLVWYACQKRKEGLSLEDLAAWVEETKLHLCHWFTVDDLAHLKRGGRINAATAFVGTMLHVKPVLHMDDQGHLVNKTKARGRKVALDTLVKKAAELGAGFDNRTMFLSHGDCLADAQYLAEQLKEHCGVERVIISQVGAVIGAHAGPGTLALFFLGEHR